MTDLIDRLNTALANRYRIKREVGSGVMAVVYLAEDLKHRRQVAVKVLRQDLAAGVVGHRFLREIEIAARLAHPNILPLHDSGDAGGFLYYVMPYVRGKSLALRLKRDEQFAIPEALRITQQVAAALHYAHTEGVVHRDIKPGNILLHEGQAVVADFGIALAVSLAGSEKLTTAGLAIGTPLYMSPEQAAGTSEVDGRSDVYSLGCLLYHMLVGHPPFTGRGVHAVLAQHMTAAIPSARSIRPTIPEHVERALQSALAKSPSDRFATAGQFSAALEGETPAAWKGTEDAAPGGRQSRPLVTSPNLGGLVSHLCNRWRQVNAFDAFLRIFHQRRTGRPQVYVIHGDEGSGHSSLVERLVQTRIKQLAEQRAGAEVGTVHRVSTPWPQGSELEFGKRDLAIALFRELDPTYMGDDLSAPQLLDLPALALSPVVVVEHDIRAKYWNVGSANLIEWYVNSFWAAITADRFQPQFLIFLKIIFEPGTNRWRLPGWRARAGAVKKRIVDHLEESVLADDIQCPWAVLDELKEVTVDDVKDWFNENAIYDSEQKRHEVAESIFEGQAAKPMAAVEAVLTEVHKTFRQEVTVQRGQSL